MAYLVGIGGGSGSGKTTIANALLRFFPEASSFSYDTYYLDHSNISLEERSKLNYDDPKALDEEALIRDLAALKRNETIYLPQYDFALHTRKKETTPFPPTNIIFVDGVMTLAIDNPKSHFDFCVYVDCDSDIRLLRRIIRDVKERGRTVESVLSQYLASVRPMHHKFVEPGRVYADFTFNNTKNDGVDDAQLRALAMAIQNNLK